MDDGLRELVVETREMVIELRANYGHVTDSVKEVKGILKWVGGLLITLIISVLGWSLVQQYSANESTKRDLQDQLRAMKSRPSISSPVGTEWDRK